MRAYLVKSPEVLRGHLAAKRTVFEPQRDGSGAAHWQVSTGGAHDTALPLPQYSSKQFFFAEREKLFSFDGRDFRETLPEPTPFVLFGVKACDLAALHYQDHFFREDPYYRKRREAALLVGIDCTAACERGFCPTVDSGPFVRELHADLVLHPPESPGENWLLITMTRNGEVAVQELQMDPAPANRLERRNLRELRVASTFPDASHIKAGVKLLNEGKISPETWDKLGVQCFACSGCTSLCPTCSCYATYDRPDNSSSEGAFERERCWDSCLYEGFQREASGHHPQPTSGQRVFRYWYHKFSDEYLPEFGRYGCTGCGRCEQTCLGIIGVHSIMKRIVADQ